jgi:hypothetical protein
MAQNSYQLSSNCAFWHSSNSNYNIDCGFVGDSAKESLDKRDETFNSFRLIDIEIEVSNIPLWKIIDKQRMCSKTLLEETILPDFNKAAVEYTAAIPA